MKNKKENVVVLLYSIDPQDSRVKSAFIYHRLKLEGFQNHIGFIKTHHLADLLSPAKTPILIDVSMVKQYWLEQITKYTKNNNGVVLFSNGRTLINGNKQSEKKYDLKNQVVHQII